MYAIITDGNRQYRVEPGQELVVDFRDKPAGEKFKFEKVLVVGGSGDAKLGSPLVKGASVAAEIIGPVQGEKHVIQKMRRRKNFRKKTGFRAMGTKVRIAEISA
jgi:large subunit ribosomal protein L21